jgi:hypothetical protein
MLKVIAAASLLVCATAASASTLIAPPTGSDSMAFRHAHSDRYLFAKDGVDVYADNEGQVPAYMFVQHGETGAIKGSMWIMHGPEKLVSAAYEAVRKDRAATPDVETHEVVACSSLGGRGFRVHEKRMSESDGAVTTYNATPSFTSVTVATGTGISGELKPLELRDFGDLLESAGAKQSDYEKKWMLLFKNAASTLEAPASLLFCDTKPLNWPDASFPLALGQPVTNAGASVPDGTTTLTGIFTVAGVPLNSAEVTVSALKLRSASYEGNNIPSAAFDSISKDFSTRYGEPYVKDHATRGDAVTETVAYRDPVSKQTVLVAQMLKLKASDTSGQLRVATRLP